jgi:transcriptional regulator with XRE-family HTH domain
VPKPTPQRAGRAPLPGFRFLTDILADNLRAWRLLRRLEQANVAEQMRAFGHRWVQQTVSEVEQGRRNITVDELAVLAMVLDVPPVALLDPMPVGGGQVSGLDVGAGWRISPPTARDWLRGRVSLKATTGPNGLPRILDRRVDQAEFSEQEDTES